ncbi:MAG: hypothetical protein JRI54_00320 [Deltaproteobacteria bacterium]|nr:hypothetical protein [Deltaproteobacteria bacterium]
MKHIVQFSGGVGSAYAAYLVIKKYSKQDVILLYHDVPEGQHPDTYTFLDDLSNFLDVPITEVSDGRTLWEVIKAHNCLPSSRIPFCNEDFKLKPAAKFYKQLNEEYQLYVGV